MSNFRLTPELRRILLEALILCALAVTVGLSLNFRMVMHAFTGKTVVMPIDAPQTSSVDTRVAAPMLFPDPVELAEIDALLAAGALLVDARNGDAYAEGHLPGAVSLPLAEVDGRLPEFLARAPKEQLLIAYCNGFGCPDSFDLGVRLLSEGYQRVLVFEGGVPEWRDSGRSLEVKR